MSLRARPAVVSRPTASLGSASTLASTPLDGTYLQLRFASRRELRRRWESGRQPPRGTGCATTLVTLNFAQTVQCESSPIANLLFCLRLPFLKSCCRCRFGPSSQTGDQECSACRLCATCCATKGCTAHALTCDRGHALESDRRARHTCDVCGTTGTAMHCAQGCDYDMCASCAGV